MQIHQNKTVKIKKRKGDLNEEKKQNINANNNRNNMFSFNNGYVYAI